MYSSIGPSLIQPRSTGECTWEPPSQYIVEDIQKFSVKRSRTTDSGGGHIDCEMKDVESQEYVLRDSCAKCGHDVYIEVGAEISLPVLVTSLIPPAAAAWNDKDTYCMCAVQKLITQFLERLIYSDEAPKNMAQKMKREKSHVSVTAWDCDLGTLTRDVSPSCLFDEPEDDLPLIDTQLVKVFDLLGAGAPVIPLKDYLNRLWRYSRASDSTFIIAILYIIRLKQLGRMKFDNRNIFKILLASLVCAAKFNEDATLTNKSLSSIGGVSLAELNLLEVSFLKLLNFRLDATVCEWIYTLQALLPEIASDAIECSEVGSDGEEVKIMQTDVIEPRILSFSASV